MKRLVRTAVLTVAVFAAFPVAADVDERLIARLAAAETVRLVVEQTYRFRPRDRFEPEPIQGYRMPFAAVARELLAGAGVRVVGPEASAFDATLAIEATGRAIGRRYAFGGDDYLFAGAEIAGGITFAAPGVAAWRTSFFGRRGPPLEVRLNLGYDLPANAPFADAFVVPGSFLPRLAEVFGAVYGAGPLIAVLDTGSPALRVSAARALGDLSDFGARDGGDVDGGAVVDALVATLADGDAELRRQAAWSLGRLGDLRAAGPLRTRLRDANADVRWFAAWALARITGASLDEMLAAAAGGDGASGVE